MKPDFNAKPSPADQSRVWIDPTSKAHDFFVVKRNNLPTLVQGTIAVPPSEISTQEGKPRFSDLGPYLGSVTQQQTLTEFGRAYCQTYGIEPSLIGLTRAVVNARDPHLREHSEPVAKPT